jgi:hypothetical protein
MMDATVEKKKTDIHMSSFAWRLEISSLQAQLY